MLGKIGAAVASAALASTAMAAAVSATPLQGNGGGDAQDDWGGSGHNLCTPGACSTTQGGMVVAWQRILYGDGYLNACGSSGVDGHFGSVTRFATAAWEQLTPVVEPDDGYVNASNWSYAGFYTHFEGTVPGGGNSNRYVYNGAERDIWFRYDGGVYKNDLGGNNLYATDHPSMGGYPFC